MKIAIALAVILFGTAMLSGTAEARCWWNGYQTVCVHPERDYWHDMRHRDYWHRDYYHRDRHFDRDDRDHMHIYRN